MEFFGPRSFLGPPLDPTAMLYWDFGKLNLFMLYIKWYIQNKDYRKKMFKPNKVVHRAKFAYYV